MQHKCIQFNSSDVICSDVKCPKQQLAQSTAAFGTSTHVVKDFNVQFHVSFLPQPLDLSHKRGSGSTTKSTPMKWDIPSWLFYVNNVNCSVG